MKGKLAVIVAGVRRRDHRIGDHSTMAVFCQTEK